MVLSLSSIAGSFDGLTLNIGSCAATGWASIVPEFTGPALPIEIRIGGSTWTSLANISRKVAGPHGFVAGFPCAAVASGLHSVHVVAQSPASSAWIEISKSPQCTFDGEPWTCGSPTPPPTPSTPTPAPVPGQVCTGDLPVVQTADCAGVEGRFVCTGSGANWVPSEATGQGAFGYCRRSPLYTPSTPLMRCCKLPDPATPRPPAPRIPPPSYPPPPATRNVAKPNIVLFLTDDQDVELGSLHAMNRTTALLRDGGATLAAHRVTTPICCPSRVSLLSGRYAHHAGVNYTNASGWCSLGVYWKGPLQNVSLPTYVRAAGYATGLFGKETNANDASTISPGWDRFFALGGTSEGHYYGDWFADQGERYDASDEEYMTDLIANRSLAWIDLQLVAKKPFFAYIAPHAPHTRATPAPESDGYFVDEIAPRPPSWNASGADKHWMVASQMPLTAKCASASDELYRNRLRALLGVDQLVGEVADLLVHHGALDSTYILYTSDHGFHLGEFRMPYFKGQPYEFDLRVPMLVRGPGIAPGSTISAMTLNIDIAPTIAALVGTTPPPEADVDGRSFAPLLFGAAAADAREGGGEEERSEAVAEWRSDILFEFWCDNPKGTAHTAVGPYCHHVICTANNTYAGVLTADGLKYIEFEDDVQFTEFYNITLDPHELRNAVHDAAAQRDIARLKRRLKQLRGCAGEGCRAPPPPSEEQNEVRAAAISS